MNQDKYLTVSAVTKYLKFKFDTDEHLRTVFLKGEISNFKHHYTGHLYFTLKDDNSLIKCIMFKSYTVPIQKSRGFVALCQEKIHPIRLADLLSPESVSPRFYEISLFRKMFS